MKPLALSTRAVHPPAGPLDSGGLSPSVHMTSVIAAETVEAAVRLESLADGLSSYSRIANPTVQAFEAAVADLEGAESAVAAPSGMAAIATALVALLRHGGTALASIHSYGDSLDLLAELAERMSLRLLVEDLASPDAAAIVLRRRPDLVLVESPSNPTLRVPDLARLAEATHEVAGILLVDSTLATPVNQQPLALGADVVLHSASKYLAGHYSVTAGVAAGSSALCGELKRWRSLLGTCLDPHAAWNVMQGMQTLAVRVERQNATALWLAEQLREHPAVLSVSYPFLDDHPDVEIARRQLRGGGGVVSLRVAGGQGGVVRFLESTRVARLAVSLGGTKTLVESPLLMSHVDGHTEDKPAAAVGGSVSARAAIPQDAVRLSVGIEDPEDLLDDLRRALDMV